MHRLKRAVARLAEVIDAAAIDAKASEAIDQTIKDFELTDDTIVPSWTLEMLAAYASGEPRDVWIPFEIVAMEASDTLEFLRLLPEWLPVKYVSEGERWTFSSVALGRECLINFEASAYVIKAIGAAEPSSFLANPASVRLRSSADVDVAGPARG